MNRLKMVCLAAVAVLSLGTLWHPEVLMALSAQDAKAAETIVRRAKDFSRQYNTEVGVLPYGDDVVHAAPPYKGGGWFDEMFVEYDISFNSAADYELWVEYASSDRRFSGVYWDGKIVQPGNLGSMTGGLDEAHQTWEKQGIVSGTRGVHVLKLRRAKEPLPHIRTIKLVLING